MDDPNLTSSNRWQRGRVDFAKAPDLGVAVSTDETLRKKIRKGDGWLIGMKPDGRVPNQRMKRIFSVFFWGGEMVWLIGWLM